MVDSRILVAREERDAFVQVKGRGSFQNAGSLKSFYQTLLKNGVDHYVVDLDECTYLDSTFLGTLTGLGLALKRIEGGDLAIINVTPRNLELLQNLGLDRLFRISIKNAKAPSQPADAEFSEAPAVEESKREAGENMLAAHENLMRLEKGNIPRFKDVVAFLREDLNKQSDA